MLKLVLGVLDVPYTHESGNGLGAKTTHEVAEILEAKWGVMQTFYDLYETQIAEALADGMESTLQATINGHIPPSRSSLTAAGDQKIEAMFRTFLDSNVMAGMTGAPGPPRRNLRKLHAYSKKARNRPVFIDTGLYRASFRVWSKKD